MYGNVFECACEVFIEGMSIGSFASFSRTDSRDSIGTEAEVEIPYYTLVPGSATDLQTGITYGEYRLSDDVNIRIASYIEVYAWYKDNELLNQTFEKRCVLRGYIRQVIGGFPTTLRCEGLEFPLRFGKITTDWKSKATIKDMLDQLIPIANAEFQNYRDENNLTYDWPKLTVGEPESKIADAEFALQIWKEASPFLAIEEVINLYKIYLYVGADGSVVASIGMESSSAPTRELSTRLNVIDRNIVPVNNMFENYLVTVKAIDPKTGKKIKKTVGAGHGTPYTPATYGQMPQADLDTLAERTYNYLKGNVNKGTIVTRLYPEVNLFDYVRYEDTVLNDYTGDYRAIGVKLEMGQNGFRQSIEVTDVKYALLQE